MARTLPAGVIGPGFNDEFGDTYGIIYGFTADGFSQRELRDYVDDIRSKLLLVPDVTRSKCSARRMSACSLNSPCSAWPASASTARR